MNLPKSLVSKIAASGMAKSILKGTPASQRPAGGQSGFNAPRSPMGMQPTTGGVNVSNKAFINAFKAQAVKGMPTSMFSRPPVIANKARGTMSSANRAAMGGI